jgi:methyl-accepting chemotaxis protein
MKEVQFRNVDKLFIKMSINDKFWVIFALFLVVLTTLSFSRYQNTVQQIEKQSMIALENKLSGMVFALESNQQLEKLTSLGIKTSSSAKSSFREDGLLTAVIKTNSKQSVALSQTAPSQEAAAKQQALNSMLLSFLWILPFGLVLYWVATFIGGALWVLWTTTENISKGDLTSRLGFHPGRDEFGTIGCALDNAMDTLTELVVIVKENAETLHKASSSLANETRQSEDQINHQHSSLDSVATAMEEMTASSMEVTDISTQASQQIENNADYIKQSDSRVQHAIKEIQQLSAYIEQTSESVITLQENTVKINDVITTISSISEQTNLLALNAAIEAARAGEMGRGFAVVADEVRTLASRTQSATLEIQAMIESLQSETNNISDMTQSTVEQALASRELILEIGNNVNSITESSKTVSDMSYQISVSSKEQSAVANNISEELSGIRVQSNTVKELVSQSSQGVVELSKASENLSKILTRYQTV